MADERDADSRTRMAEQALLAAEDFDAAAEDIRDDFIADSIRLYFDRLLSAKGLAGHEVIERANIERGFGRQILNGRRRTVRDNYIKIAIAAGLSVEETQSLLKYVGTGPLYAMRKRDAALIFCLSRGYTLMDTQLFLDEHELAALGDPQEAAPVGGQAPRRHSTQTVERLMLEAADFDDAAEQVGDAFIRESIRDYFDRLLEARGMKGSQALKRAGINPNFGFQILRGERRTQRDNYIRLAYGLGLGLEETQRMLTFMQVAPLYALTLRDAAVIFCMNRGFDLARTQHFLHERGLPLLGGAGA